MDFTSQSLYLAPPRPATGQLQVFEDSDSWWMPPFRDTLTQAIPFNEMNPFGVALTEATPRFLSNEGRHVADEERQQLWGVPAIPAAYPAAHPSLSAEVPMMEAWTSTFPHTLSTPNTPPYQVPGFAYASASDFPNSGLLSTFPGYDPPDDWFEFSMEYPKSAPDRHPGPTRPDNYPPMRETLSSKNVKLAGQARARPSSITSSAQRVEAPPANRGNQPSAATRRPTGSSPAAVAQYSLRSSFAANLDPQSMTAPIPTSLPPADPSQSTNNAGVTLSSPASSKLALSGSSSISSEVPSPPRFMVKRFIDYTAQLQSQGQKRPRKDGPMTEKEMKRRKINEKERRWKKTKNEFQQDPTIIGWSFEDGKGEKDIFRNKFGPPRR